MNPKLSVAVLTYNHERFIEQALEGLSRQRVPFPIEVIISDDESRDQTFELVERWNPTHKGATRRIRRETNLGLVNNFLTTILDCRGEYVAILEGDDYWTDPYKLATQVQFLDSHSECSSVFHDVELLFEDGRRQDHCCPDDVPEMIRLEQCIAHNFVPNCSALVMRNRGRQIPKWFKELDYYDWPLHVINAQEGPMAFLSRAMSVYRIHGQSAWHGRDVEKRSRQVVKIFDALDKHFESKYSYILNTLKELYLTKAHTALLESEVHRLGNELAGHVEESNRLREHVQQLTVKAAELARSSPSNDSESRSERVSVIHRLRRPLGQARRKLRSLMLPHQHR